MAVELKVPEMGESVTEVYIGQWQKNEGDRVEQDEQLVELESEKATLDLRAPAAGRLAKILKQSGDSAEVGEVIGHLEEDGADQESATRDTETPRHEEPAPARPEQTRSNSAPSPRSDAGEAEEPTAATKTEEKEENVAAAANPKSKQEAQEPAGEAVKVPPTVDDKNGASPPARSEKRVPMSPVRRRIAAHLVEAQQNAALLTTFNEIDMSAVKSLRREHGELFERRHGVRLGFMSFFVKATVEALRQHPELNAMIDGDDIVHRNYYDIGVAISSDKGLVVPVLRDADRMSFAQIEQAIDEFAKRARSAALKVDDLTGGTFTITNGGVFGSLLSTPIVNPPQSGVLGMHAIQDRPVAIHDEIVIRPMMYVALTYDHRMVDGRDAVTFLRRIKETIEAPARMLIEV